MLKEHTLLFKILIGLDRLLNVITGGSFQDCLSTRAYVNAQEKPVGFVLTFWRAVENGINLLFFDKDHCKNSFIWECSIKEAWLLKHEELLDDV